MAKRNGNGNGKENRSPKRKNKLARRDRPLPSTLPADLKPYDTNNDGVLSQAERLAMARAKAKERSKEDLKPKRKVPMDRKGLMDKRKGLNPTVKTSYP